MSELLMLHYHVSESDKTNMMNIINLKKIQSLVGSLGVALELDKDDLYISVDANVLSFKKKRNAGNKRKKVKSGNLEKPFIRYSDIVYRFSYMSDAAIMKEIGMAKATYYRHKKTLIRSDYYKSLDKSRISDKGYLEGIDGNRTF